MNKETTREKILKTSFNLFLKKGLTNVSINEIIKKGGFSKGGFFHYFKNKDQLLREAIEYFIVPYIEIINKNMNSTYKTTYDKLNFFFELIPNYNYLIRKLSNDKTIDSRSLYLLMMEVLRKFSYFRKQYSKIFLRIYVLIKEQLIEGQEKGEINKAIDLEEVSYKILVAYEGCLHLWVVQPDIDLNKLNKKLLDSIWNSIKV